VVMFDGGGDGWMDGWGLIISEHQRMAASE